MELKFGDGDLFIRHLSGNHVQVVKIAETGKLKFGLKVSFSQTGIITPDHCLPVLLHERGLHIFPDDPVLVDVQPPEAVAHDRL